MKERTFYALRCKCELFSGADDDKLWYFEYMTARWDLIPYLYHEHNAWLNKYASDICNISWENI